MSKVLKLNAVDLKDGTFNLINIFTDNIGCEVDIVDSAVGTAQITIVINIERGAQIIESTDQPVADNFYFELKGAGTTKNSIDINLTKKLLTPTVSMQNTNLSLDFTFDGKAGSTIIDQPEYNSIESLFNNKESKREFKK